MGMVNVELNKANPTSFELTFPLIPNQSTLTANEELVLNIYGCILPAVSMPNLEQNWQNAKRQVAGGPTEFEILNCQFLVDASFRNWKLLFDWMTYISDNHEKMLENYADYAVDTTLRIMDNFGSDVMAIKFVGMWPTNLQEVSFSVREGEVQLEGGATFLYDYFVVRENI
jgi:hypothetical protein